MNNLAWIIAVDQFKAFGNAGVSPNYIIPSPHMNGLEHKIRNSRIWIIVRGLEDKFVAVITPMALMRFSEGYYKDDFLLSSNLNQSVRIRSEVDGERSNVQLTKSCIIGFNLISSEIVKVLTDTLRSGVQYKFIKPSQTFFQNIEFPIFPSNPINLLSLAIAKVSSSFSLDQIWGSAPPGKLDPIKNFAIQLLSQKGFLTNVVLETNTSLTAIDDILENDEGQKTPNNKKKHLNTVDLNFEAIDPKMIYAREFIFSDVSSIDYEYAIAKTELAEKIHQEMLRDISNHLLLIGITSYQSQSIDLMIHYKSQVNIFEIKSANSENVISQASKGAFQLAGYADVASTLYPRLTYALIMHKISDAEIETFVLSVLNRLGIKCLIYDPSLAWPYRIVGLLD